MIPNSHPSKNGATSLDLFDDKSMPNNVRRGTHADRHVIVPSATQQKAHTAIDCWQTTFE
jgi:hypothetical protein